MVASTSVFSNDFFSDEIYVLFSEISIESQIKHMAYKLYCLALDIISDSLVWVKQLNGFKSLVIKPLEICGQIPVLPGFITNSASEAKKLVNGVEFFSKIPTLFSTNNNENLYYSCVVKNNKNYFYTKCFQYGFKEKIAIKVSIVTDWISTTIDFGVYLSNIAIPAPLDWTKTIANGIVAIEGCFRESKFLYQVYSNDQKIGKNWTVAWQSVASSVLRVAMNVLLLGFVGIKVVRLIFAPPPLWVARAQFWTSIAITIMPIATHYWHNLAIDPLYNKK